MADETNHIRGINWRETFLFTHIFRAFGIAIHPSKMILALAAICLLYIGGRTLDAIWTSGSRGVKDEIAKYEHARTPSPLDGAMAGGRTDFNKTVEQERKNAREHYASLLEKLEIKNSNDKLMTNDERYEAALNGSRMSDIKNKIIEKLDQKTKLVKEQHKYVSSAMETGTLAAIQSKLTAYLAVLNDDAKAKVAKAELEKGVLDAENEQSKKDKLATAAEHETEADKRKDAVRTGLTEYNNELIKLYADAEGYISGAEAIQGYGLFILMVDYQIERVNDMVNGVTSNNWFGGLTDNAPSGVFNSLYRMVYVAPRWAITHHFFYFVIYGFFFFIIWAIFGGAIARIAAIHVSRDEKPSVRSALRFSTGKFFSFMCAPVIPVLIIAAVGLIVAIGGLLLYIPVVGEILVGIFYFLALAAGFVMTLVTIGTVGGINLMFPTIASEGSDSFDAISRSFSYVYARPWRMFWYTCVSIAYGALTFLFVRIFIYLMLAFTHYFTVLMVSRKGNSGAPVFQGIWPGSRMTDLTYHINHLSLNFGQRIAAFFVAIWVFLAIAALGAYLISYYFSSSAIVYFLMRREVDATEMDDVYLEQLEEEFTEPTPATTTAASGSSTPIQPTAAPTDKPAGA